MRRNGKPSCRRWQCSKLLSRTRTACWPKWIRQAKKDSETINKGASLAGGSSAKAKAICKQLADSLGPVQQKASYAKTEFDNLLAKIRVDKNLGRDQLAKIGAKAYKEVDEIGQSLETLTSNLDSVIGELRDVGS